jgi:hypothetical protein
MSITSESRTVKYIIPQTWVQDVDRPHPASVRKPGHRTFNHGVEGSSSSALTNEIKNFLNLCFPAAASWEAHEKSILCQSKTIGILPATTMLR